MRPALLIVTAAALAAGCGSEIGDACISSTDCAQDGTRICDLQSTGGYCTVPACDYGTCPSEAVCVRFFTGTFSNRTCDPVNEDKTSDMCTPDEVCALDGHCVNRSSEVRYCMRTCGSNSDCRSGYECRDEATMKMDGGEPVPAEDQRLCGDTQDPKTDGCTPIQSFCSQAPSTGS